MLLINCSFYCLIIWLQCRYVCHRILFRITNIQILLLNIWIFVSILQTIRSWLSHSDSDYCQVNDSIISFVLKIKADRLRSFLRNFTVDIRTSLRYTKGQSRKWWLICSQDSLYLTYSRIFSRFFYILHWFVTRNCQHFYLTASCDKCHALGRRHLLNPDHLVVLLAGPISHTSTQYMDFVEIFNIVYYIIFSF